MSGLGYADPAPFAKGKTLGEALLTPTRIYVKPMLKASVKATRIKALAHITGGGFIENIPRVLPKGRGRNRSGRGALPPVFGWLQQVGGVAEREMLRTFNCGIGMIVVVAARDAKARGGLAHEIGREGGHPRRHPQAPGQEEQVATFGHLRSDERKSASAF